MYIYTYVCTLSRQNSPPPRAQVCTRPYKNIHNAQTCIVFLKCSQRFLQPHQYYLNWHIQSYTSIMKGHTQIQTFKFKHTHTHTQCRTHVHTPCTSKRARAHSHACLHTHTHTFIYIHVLSTCECVHLSFCLFC